MGIHVVHEGRRTQRATRHRRNVLVASALGGIAALAVAAALLLAPGAPRPISAEGDPTLGAAEAPVLVAAYSDFQCPFCRRFELEGAFDRLVARHVETGEARFVAKDFPILGDDSWAAAQASKEVWRQSPATYWTWHRSLFEAQGPERSGWASPERLVAHARTFPTLDADALAAALADGRHRSEVAADVEAGRAAGVRSTPTLVVDGRVVAALDEAAVERAIADALEARR